MVDGARAALTPPPGWYRELAQHLGEAYLKYAFTRASVQEAEFIAEALDLERGERVLDVGCGPGRHALQLARMGYQVVGVDISERFLEIARAGARAEGLTPSFFALDARHLPFEEEFDAAISLCEGGFGLGGEDLAILRAVRTALKPRGRVAVGAPNLLFVLRHLAAAGEFDPESLTFSEEVEVIGEDGTKKPFRMWNSCYTSRELAWIANGAGLVPKGVWGVSPGDYARRAPGFDHPELLLTAYRAEEEVKEVQNW